MMTATPTTGQICEYLNSTAHIGQIYMVMQAGMFGKFTVRPAEPRQLVLPKFNMLLHVDGSFGLTVDSNGNFARVRPGWFARRRIRRAVRIWALARNIRELI